MKIIILVAIVTVLAETSRASSIARGPEYGEKQEIPSIPPLVDDGQPGVKIETSASEQGQPQPLKVEISANEQGQQQDKTETSLRQQGDDGAGDDAYLEEAFNEEEAKAEAEINANLPNGFNEEEAEEEAESNADLEDIANANQVISLGWPYGRYALPKATSGCPPGWRSGTRYQDNEDSYNANSASFLISRYMSVTVNRNLRMKYCVKTLSGHPVQGRWPAGRYCIARKGGSCPRGFRSGSVFWDDEDNRNTNSFSGTLPDGVYNRNTKIYYCCRSDGRTSRAISLPTTTPFILYRYGSSCQLVRGMTVRSLYIRTDDENNHNINRCLGSHPAGRCGPNIRLNYCYYSRSIGK